MKQFVLERVVQAPIDQVFARLVDIDGYNAWMPKLEAPPTLVYHGWEKSKKGKLTMYGIYGFGAPVFRRFAVKERTVTIDALKASFESGSAAG